MTHFEKLSLFSGHNLQQLKVILKKMKNKKTHILNV